jgi:hypothetical protein
MRLRCCAPHAFITAANTLEAHALFLCPQFFFIAGCDAGAGFPLSLSQRTALQAIVPRDLAPPFTAARCARCTRTLLSSARWRCQAIRCTHNSLIAHTLATHTQAAQCTTDIHSTVEKCGELVRQRRFRAKAHALGMSACVEKMVLPTCAESDRTQQLLPTRTRNSKADFIRSFRYD